MQAFGWFVMCKPFWSVHGLHGLLGFALTSSCSGLGLNFRPDGNYLSRDMYCALPTFAWGLAGQLMKFFSCQCGFGFFTFACRSGLSNLVASLGFTRRAVPHPKINFTRNYKKTKFGTATRTKNTKYKNKYGERRAHEKYENKKNNTDDDARTNIHE